MTSDPAGGIHPTAVVAPGASLGQRVSIGPYSTVGEAVVLGDDVWVGSHVNLEGATTIGKGAKVFPFASIGSVPQDLKFEGEPTRLEIGERTVMREHVTINPGTAAGGGVTRVGSDCLLMIGVHVAHDCHLGNHVIVANNAGLSGHVTVEDDAILGGQTGVHQHCRIGQLAMVGGMSGVYEDVLPFCLCAGHHAKLNGLNLVGLRRRNVANETIREMQSALQALFADGESLSDRAQRVRDQANSDEVRVIADFALAPSSRGIMGLEQS